MFNANAGFERIIGFVTLAAFGLAALSFVDVDASTAAARSLRLLADLARAVAA